MVAYQEFSNFSILSLLIKFKLRWFIIAKDLLVNEKIGNKDVRVIDDASGPLGVMNSIKALEMAKERGLDLVEIVPNARPPVCKIIDYGKLCFERKKKEKEAKRNQKNSELKKIRLSVKIDSGDFNTKLEHARRFILDGNKVEISIRFKGREVQHSQLGIDVLNDFCDRCFGFAEVIKKPKLEGRQVSSILSPLSSKTKELRRKEALSKEDNRISADLGNSSQAQSNDPAIATSVDSISKENVPDSVDSQLNAQ